MLFHIIRDFFILMIIIINSFFHSNPPFALIDDIIKLKDVLKREF